MRIWVWGINYEPETVGIGPFNTALCRFLVARGHEVEMLTTFTYYPTWQKAERDRWALFRMEELSGVRVHRAWHYVPRLVSAWKRVVHEGTFVGLSFLRGLSLGRPDLIVVISPPLLLGAAAWVLGMMKGVPFVFHVQDLQPDAASGLGMLKPGWFLRRLYELEALAYRKAALVSAISPAMVERIVAKGVPAEKVRCFPNGVDLGTVIKLPEKGRFRARMGWNEELMIVLYSGNLGKKQGLGQLIEAARFLRNERIQIVIAGDGAGRAELEEMLSRKPSAQVKLLPLQREEHYVEMLVDSEVCLVVQEAGAGACFLPSKLLKILAHGRPVLAVADAESPLAQAVEEGKFGRVTPPHQAQKLAGTLEKMSHSKLLLEEQGMKGREYVEQFRLERVQEEYGALLDRVVNNSLGKH